MNKIITIENAKEKRDEEKWQKNAELNEKVNSLDWDILASELCGYEDDRINHDLQHMLAETMIKTSCETSSYLSEIAKQQSERYKEIRRAKGETVIDCDVTII